MRPYVIPANTNWMCLRCVARLLAYIVAMMFVAQSRRGSSHQTSTFQHHLDHHLHVSAGMEEANDVHNLDGL